MLIRSIEDRAIILRFSVLLGVEEFSVLEVIVRVVTGEGIGDNFSVCVSEVDVSHVLFIVEHIRVQSVVVPVVMQIVLALVMSDDHGAHKLGHSVEHVCPKDGSNHVEPGINGSQ